MDWGDVPDDDMNENLFPFHRREPGLPAADADKLLRGEAPAAGSAPEVQAVSDLLGALCEPAYASELGGVDAAVAAFSAAKEKEKVLASDEPRRRSVLSVFTGAKLAVAAVAGSLALGGVAAAACTGSLPGPFQDVAHTLGAPGAQSDGDGSVLGVSDPTGSASASPSASASGTHQPGTGHWRGHGPSAFALCWFVVHKPDVTLPTAAPTQTPATNDDDSVKTDGWDHGSWDHDGWDHGRGEWSQAYAKLQAAAMAKGETVLQLCTALLANHPKPHPTTGKHGTGDPGHGTNDGQGGFGRGQGPSSGGHGPDGHGSSGQGGDGQGSNGQGSNGHGGDGQGGGFGGSGGQGSGRGGSGH